MKKEKIRKVFLEELPRKANGKIEWRKCLGIKVKFIYEEIEDYFIITGYDSKSYKIKVIYKEKEREIHISSLKQAKLRTMLGLRSSECKYNIGDFFKDDKRDLVVTDKEYRERSGGKGFRKWYKYTCNVCGWTEGWMVEGDLSNGVGCSCCYGKTTVLGINTIWDTDRWMCDLGVSEEDAKTHMKCSHDKVMVVCPDCGNKKKTTISHIYKNKSISCICNNRGKYPERFMVSVLNQLEIGFKSQYTPEWINRKLYDFYLPKYNIIIETHGFQHYEQAKGFYKTLEEEQENDRIKEETALVNGVDKYIIIDCRKSDMEWIKNSILNSELSKLFDLSTVDWNKCEEFALSNLVKEVCEYWNNKQEWETTQTIANDNPWGIKSAETIRAYLKSGTILGWTSYNPKQIMIENGLKACKNKGIKVICLENGIKCDSIVKMAKIMSDLTNEIFTKEKISDVIKKKRNNYKGFTFKEVV